MHQSQLTSLVWKGINNADDCFSDNESSLPMIWQTSDGNGRDVYTKVNINKCVYNKRGCWRWTQINRYAIGQGWLEMEGKTLVQLYPSEFTELSWSKKCATAEFLLRRLKKLVLPPLGQFRIKLSQNIINMSYNTLLHKKCRDENKTKKPGS